MLSLFVGEWNLYSGPWSLLLVFSQVFAGNEFSYVGSVADKARLKPHDLTTHRTAVLVTLASFLRTNILRNLYCQESVGQELKMEPCDWSRSENGALWLVETSPLNLTSHCTAYTPCQLQLSTKCRSDFTRTWDTLIFWAAFPWHCIVG